MPQLPQNLIYPTANNGVWTYNPSIWMRLPPTPTRPVHGWIRGTVLHNTLSQRWFAIDYEIYVRGHAMPLASTVWVVQLVGSFTVTCLRDADEHVDEQ